MEKLKSLPKEFWRSLGLSESKAEIMSTIRAKQFHIVDTKRKIKTYGKTKIR
jgi:hypothetical protein